MLKSAGLMVRPRRGESPPGLSSRLPGSEESRDETLLVLVGAASSRLAGEEEKDKHGCFWSGSWNWLASF